MNKRQEYKKKINKHLKDLEKRGIDIIKVTKGKTIEQLSNNIKSFDKFMLDKKRVLQGERIRKTNIKKLEKEKVNLREILLEQKEQANINKKSKNIFAQDFFKKQIPQYTDLDSVNNLHDIKVLKKKIKETDLNTVTNILTKESANEFLTNRYFQTFKAYPNVKERIDNLTSAFGNNIGLLNDFMEIVTSQDFKIYTDSSQDKYSTDFDADSFESMMYQRLEHMEFLAYNRYGLKK